MTLRFKIEFRGTDEAEICGTVLSATFTVRRRGAILEVSDVEAPDMHALFAHVNACGGVVFDGDVD